MKTMENKTQHNMLMEEQKILHIPSMKIFDNDWNLLQKFLERKSHPPYTIGGDLKLRGIKIKSLGNLRSVGGSLDLRETNIESLRTLQSVGGYLDLFGTDIKSLGNLQSVGGGLDLYDTKIQSLGNLRSVGDDLDLRHSNIESFGNLRSVGGELYMYLTPMAVKYSKEEIKQMVQVDGSIIL